jgi:hypothetical protein
VNALARSIRELGWLDGCLYALARLLTTASGGRALLYKYYFVEQPIPEKRRLSPARGASLEIRRMAAGDPVLADFPRPQWVFPYRFDQLAICLAALKEGKGIGFLWFTLSAYQEDEVRCRYVPLPEGVSAWDFDVYVAPEHRTGIAFMKLWDEANMLLSSRGFRWSLSRISAFNAGSMLAHAKMGASPIGSAVFLKLGGWQLCVASLPPYVHFSTHAGSFPTLRLSAAGARATERR